MGFTPGLQGFFNVHKSINVIHHIKRLTDKNHMIVSIDTEKAFDKIQHPFMIKKKKNSSESRHRQNIPHHNRSDKHYPQWQKIESISPKLRNRQGYPFSPLLFNIVLKVLVTAIKEEKKIKGIQI